MILIDPDVFAWFDDRDQSNETFRVTGTFDDEAVTAIVAALERAAERFMVVDATGVEHTEQAGVEAALAAGVDTPSYVSDPEVSDDGIEIYVDSQGSIEAPMAITLRSILAEELDATDLEGRVIAVPFED